MTPADPSVSQHSNHSHLLIDDVRERLMNLQSRVGVHTFSSMNTYDPEPLPNEKPPPKDNPVRTIPPPEELPPPNPEEAPEPPPPTVVPPKPD